MRNRFLALWRWGAGIYALARAKIARRLQSKPAFAEVLLEIPERVEFKRDRSALRKVEF